MKFLLLNLIMAAFAMTVSAEKMDADGWRKLVEETVRLGETTEVGDGIVFKTVEHKNPLDDRGSYHAEYFSVVGYAMNDGTFVSSYVSTVSETWMINDEGNWEIDQWIFQSDLENLLRTATHIFMVQNPDRRVLEHRTLRHGGVESKEVQQLWNDKVAFWVNRVLGPALF